MANRYYGVAVGGSMPTEVTESGSTTSKDVELVVNLSAAGTDKVQVLKALEAISNYVATDTWPPA
jgi:hypothetical protein